MRSNRVDGKNMSGAQHDSTYPSLCLTLRLCASRCKLLLLYNLAGSDMPRSERLLPPPPHPVLPYWLVNVPDEQWPSSCPVFLRDISAKNERVVGTPDEHYRRLSWEEVQEILRWSRSTLVAPHQVAATASSTWAITLQSTDEP